MKTWTATTTVEAPPEAVLDVLTDPGACARWAPVDFAVDDLATTRLVAGSRPRVRGRLAGVEVGFDVEVLEAGGSRLALRAAGPVAFDVAYDLEPADGGSEVRASVGVRPAAACAGDCSPKPRPRCSARAPCTSALPHRAGVRRRRLIPKELTPHDHHRPHPPAAAPAAASAVAARAVTRVYGEGEAACTRCAASRSTCPPASSPRSWARRARASPR
jgi:hypothetical protein